VLKAGDVSFATLRVWIKKGVVPPPLEAVRGRGNLSKYPRHALQRRPAYASHRVHGDAQELRRGRLLGGGPPGRRADATVVQTFVVFWAR
jgi:hypothetical protein